MLGAQVIGIDAGGTGVRARTDDASFTLLEAANARTVGVEATARRILRVIEHLAKGMPVASVYIGAAGAGDPAIANALLLAIARALPRECIVGVGDDLHIALRSTVDGDGIALVAGTGSIAYAEIQGKRYRTGGYGPLLGDEGSGFAIGAAALRLTLRAMDGRAPSDTLTEEIERSTGTDAHEILGRTRAASGDTSGIAAVAPVVLHCAARGVASAVAILETAALELAGLVRRVFANVEADRLAKTRDLPLVLCGGLLTHENPLVESVRRRIRRELPSLTIVNGGEPALGALKAAHASLASRGFARS
jgi:N-acetylmuramic acid 6-phosphate etherase